MTGLPAPERRCSERSATATSRTHGQPRHGGRWGTSQTTTYPLMRSPWPGKPCEHAAGSVTDSPTPELRETRDAALFHQAGATTLANSTIARLTAHARLFTARYAED